MAAPEIRLSIGLDLEFFRGQMRKAVNIAQSEFTAQLAVKIDRNKLNTELNNLQKAIKRRTYRIEIGGNLEKAPDKIASLKKALSDLEGTKIDLGIGGITSIGRDEARKIRTALRRSILENGGKILVPTSIVAAITDDDVAAFQAIAKRKLSGIKVSLSIVAGINSEDIATFKEATQAKLSGIKVPVSILPKILTEDITAFKEAVKNKLSGIKVKVGVEAQLSGAGAGAATVPGEKKRPAGYEAALQSIGNLQVEQLRKRAFSSLGEESRTAQQVSTWLNTIVDQGLKGKAKASQLTAVREFLAEGLATAAGKNIEARMQPIQGRDPNRRGAFPYVAKTGPIESKVLFAEAIALAAKIDAQLAEQARLLQEQARLLQEQTRRQAEYLARQNELLRNAATRFLPSAKEQIGGRSAQSQVVGNFYDRIRKTEKVFAQNFSANSYLSKSTINLAAAMQQAAQGMKLLPGARGPIAALPSREMVGARKFKDAIRMAREIDLKNTLDYYNSKKYLPQAGQTSYRSPEQIAGKTQSVATGRQLAGDGRQQASALITSVRGRMAQLSLPATKGIDALNAAIRDLGGKAAVTASKIQGKVKSALREAGDFVAGEGKYYSQSSAGVGKDGSVLRKVSDFISGDSGRRTGTGPATPPLTSTTPVPPGGPPATPPLTSTTPVPPGRPPAPPGGGGAGAGGAGRRGGGIGGLNIPSLPGTGLVQELGTEFAFAAKQVLLFGTAYKALAFLTGFPQQVGDAVGQLQSFRNTLSAISPTAQEAANSSQFILSVVDKYNVPLQSARDGFTKLYASMAPTGFSGNEIRDLFLGISQAAATFGMSADKVDRVTYAFAQMASKGQVMSEELKGQLGDVLPGAMGIFAKAAGFEGADAIQKFGKALEDGAFKGKPMRDLLKNVTIELKKEFGPGAEGAARTYQGVMTRMANSTKLLYESFEPVAINFLNSIVVPITSGLKTVTDGFKAFFTGQAAQTTGGSAFAKQLELLRPAFEGIRSNIASLVPIFANFGKILLVTSQVFLQIASNPFVGYLARVYLNVIALTTVVNILNLRALIPFIANLARSIYSVAAFGVQCELAGKRALFFDLIVRTLGGTLRTFFAATAVGIILVGIGLIAEAFVTAGARADAARQKMSQFADSVKQLGAMGDIAGATAEKVGQQSLAARLQSAKALLQQVKTEGKKLTKDQVQELKNLQLTGNLDFVEVRRGPEKGLLVAQGKITDLLGTQSALQSEIESAGRGYLETQTKIVQATKAVAAAQGVQKKTEEETKAVDLAGGEETNPERAIKEAERLASEVQRRAIEAANQGNALMQINFQKDLELTDAAFDHKKNMLDALHDYEMSGLNDMQARQKKFEKDLKDIQMQRVDAIRKALQKVEEARVTTQAAVNVEGAAGVPSAPSLPGPIGGGGVFDTGMRTGPSSAIGGSADYHQDIMFGSTVSMKERVQLMDQLARGYEAIGRTIEFSNNAVANERYKSSMSYEAKSSLISRAQAAHANRPRGSGRAAMDYYAPLASQRRSGPSVVGQAMLAPTVEGASYSYGGGGRSGRTMTASRNGSMVYEQLHGSMAVPLQGAAPSRSSTVNTMARRETAEAYDLERAKAKENASLTIAQLDVQNKVVLAYQQTASIIKQNIDSIYPIEKIKLENKLSKIRNDLQMQGMPEELIAYEEKRVAAMEEGAMAQKVLTDNIADTEAKLKKAQSSTAAPGEAEMKKAAAINSLNGELTLYKQTLDSLPAKQKELNVAMLEGAIATIKNAEALKIQQDAIALVNGSVEGATSSYKGFVKEVMQGGDPTEALKKFQESLRDQVLTIFLDYAFKPVEDFLKDSLKNMLNLPTEEDQRKKAIDDAEKQLAHLKTIDANVGTIAGQSPQAGAAAPAATTAVPATGGQAAGGPIPLTVIPFGGAESSAMSSTLEGAQSSISKSMEGIASSVEKSSFKLLEGVPPFEQALTIDLPGQVEKSTEALKAKGSTFNESLGKLTQGVGIAIGSIMGIAAGISQVKKGGTGNTLMGIGSVLASIGGAIGGFSKLSKAANGAVWTGGFQAFANGGMVKGPTLGLVGEGKYNEAIVPLPDGRSIPVQMRGGPGGGSSRDLLASQSQSRSSPSVLSMSFQSTTINGVEYVDRAQLEMAMAETRRVASRDGAARGANLAIDRLANSPSSRRRAGIR
jgi:tape measure domain-containing protein